MKWKRITLCITATLIILTVVGLLISQPGDTPTPLEGDWWTVCPPDPPYPTPYPPQPTYPPNPTYTSAPTPTCRPTYTPVIEPTYTRLPTHTPYPTYTPYPPQPGETGANGEMKALWAWRGYWETTPGEMDKRLDRAVQGGFNTVLFYVGSGAVNYNSTLLPSSIGDFDALGYVVEQGHARGLNIQAWWCPGEVFANSSFRARYPSEWDAISLDGIDEHWLNFSLPEVREFVASVVVEIATNYDVDGVHLDYIRYEPPPPWGSYDPADFFNSNDVPLTVELCYQRLKEVSPNVLLTAAVMSSLGSSEGHLQNWDRWLEYIDYVMPMAYYAPEDTYIDPSGGGTLERDAGWWQILAAPEKVVPGLKVDTNGVLKTPEELIEQIELCRGMGFENFAIYSEYGVPGEFLDALREY